MTCADSVHGALGCPLERSCPFHLRLVQQPLLRCLALEKNSISLGPNLA